MPRRFIGSGFSLFRIVLLLFLAVFFLCPEGQGGMFRRRESEDEPKAASGRVGAFPETDEVDGLTRVGRILTYKNDKFQQLYGAAGNRYIQYGMVNMMSCDYTYGDRGGTVSIEIANMQSNTAAAGLFHYHRGSVLRNSGDPVEVGAEGVIDTPREKRNLYFYRGKQFVKIVYSGPAPVPPLFPIAEVIDGRMPKGRDDRPDGFEYIDIDGINKNTVTLTPGFTFGYNFLPPSVSASAPGGGSPASDMFVITKIQDSEALELYKGYSTYLRLNAEYFEEYKRGRQNFVKAVDPRQGRVLFTAYKNCFIIAARPDGYEKGEELIDRVIEKIDQRRGGPSAGDKGQEKKPRRGLFRRRAG